MFAYFSSSISKCFYLTLDSINTKTQKVVNKITFYILHIWHSFGGGTGHHLRNTPDGMWSPENVLNYPILLQLHLCLWNSFELIFFFFLKAWPFIPFPSPDVKISNSALTCPRTHTSSSDTSNWPAALMTSRRNKLIQQERGHEWEVRERWAWRQWRARCMGCWV